MFFWEWNSTNPKITENITKYALHTSLFYICKFHISDFKSSNKQPIYLQCKHLTVTCVD